VCVYYLLNATNVPHYHHFPFSHCFDTVMAVICYGVLVRGDDDDDDYDDDDDDDDDDRT